MINTINHEVKKLKKKEKKGIGQSIYLKKKISGKYKKIKIKKFKYRI